MKGRIPSLFNIEGNIKKKQEQQNTVESNDGNLPNDYFSPGTLQEEWNAFLDKIKNNTPAYSTLKAFVVHKESDNLISITYASDSSKKHFEDMVGDFFANFKKKVNNYNITIEYRQKALPRISVKNNRDIFYELAHKYPLLKELDDLLKFDFN
ncbi:hypothetical protein [Riemerella columbipharyngis]|uniref:DNA polymerase-3 subunit gamma/tau n=1 Tax=Riemerella columbipharyngis TaxID=1071918 RepID=A0A1G6YQ86_9FLAO|nr:hypothetical protein [Riemerella columbipharyngis]SDD91795.1 hypothetical protein SAMN05421544_101214 [Riemerella columbipharyngis]